MSGSRGNDLSRSPARLDAANNTLGWYYYNAGDLNVDGTVRITDITVMGQHYDPIGPYHPNSQAGMLDVNHDQVQNEGDADLVVNYLGNTIVGYNVYRSSNIDDYPTLNNAESVIAKVGFVAFGNMHSAWEGDDYRPYYVYNTTEPNQYHWVRPVDAYSATKERRVYCRIRCCRTAMFRWAAVQPRFQPGMTGPASASGTTTTPATITRTPSWA